MRELIFYIAHSLGMPYILSRRRVNNREICVLMLHRVSDDIDPLWPPLPVSTFEHLMEVLSKKAHVASVDDVISIDEYPNKPLVVLSFDDGYMDFYHNALPILNKYSLPAHHNICPGLIGSGVVPWTQMLGHYMGNNTNTLIELPDGEVFQINREPNEGDLLSLAELLMRVDDQLREQWLDALIEQMPVNRLPQLMGWEEVRQCVAAGIEIGSHGMSHRNMAQIADDGILKNEVEMSKRTIEQETGQQVNIFSFPNGEFNKSGLELVRQAGYKTAIVCENMIARHPCDAWEKQMHILPRINISRADWREEHLRLLGFHQLLAHKLHGDSYAFSYGKM